VHFSRQLRSQTEGRVKELFQEACGAVGVELFVVSVFSTDEEWSWMYNLD